MELSNICTHHRTDLNIQDKIIKQIKQFSVDEELIISIISSRNCQNRLRFVKKNGRKFQTEQLKHKDVVVSATVAVFNLETMIMSL